MSRKKMFQYSVLQYCHDVVTGERVNVGILLHNPSTGHFICELSSKYARLKKIFPDLDSEAFQSSIKSIERSLKQASRSDRGGFLSSLEPVGMLAHASLVQDDSSFQWSNAGSVFGSNLEDEAQRLYQRFVTWHESENFKKKSDEDVWRPVKERLAARNLDRRLQATKLRSAVAQVTFDHSWKNGAWHCYQPLSFDLASAENINEKVARWSGHLYHLDKANTDFVPYFIVGAPSSQALEAAYTAAVEALKQAPSSPHIYGEDQLDDLVDTIQDEMAAHDRAEA